ncbi:NIM1-INTERACTING 1 [Olea europaea subsp. europaea]|uniref:NIM1-INTERACTING 1 n=1 Tax=Olea europaea subsp. europaea TaxID=158383 RepID=A0A8S0TVC4_OLEEU|nr:NIM1-INTERACTING 1 [Olea europaea subsp. europaea]
MDGERNKRKMENRENEEEQMKSFFASIKNIRDIRRSMMSRGDQSNKQDNVKPIEDKPPAPVVAWNPLFQPEDFMDDPPQTPLNFTAQLDSGGHSKGKKEEEPKDEDQGGDTGLDLNLSL